MKLKLRVLIIISLVSLIVFSGCSSPNRNANELSLKASQLVQLAQETEETSYSNAFKLYEDALEKMEEITSEYPTSQLASEISQGQAKIGHYTITEFRETIIPQAKLRADAEEDPLACALLLAKTLSKDSVLEEVAVAYAKIGEFDQALQIAELVKDVDPYYLSALENIAIEYYKAGKKNESFVLLLKAFNIIESPEMKSDPIFMEYSALEDVVLVYVKIGEYNKALQIINTYGQSDTLLHDAAIICAEASDLDQALQFGYMIEDISYSSRTRFEIYITFASVCIDTLGKKDEISKILPLTLKSIEAANEMDDPLDRVYVLTSIAVVFGKLGDEARANEILAQAFKLAKKHQEDKKKEDAFWAWVGFLETRGGFDDIAVAYAKIGEFDQASLVTQKISSYISSEDKVLIDKETIRDIAIEYVKIGEYDKALQMADTLESSGYKDEVITEIALAYAKNKNYIKAFQLVKEIESQTYKATALSSLAVMYAKDKKQLNEKIRAILHEIIKETT